MIDAHQHFWCLSRGDYAWPNESVAPIFRDFGPDDLKPLLAKAGVSQTILVQATDTLAETEYLLALAAREKMVAGVVGWVDLAAPDAVEIIDRLRVNPMLKGLRPMLQNIPETGWILREEVQPALAHMAQIGLCFDALVQPRHLPAILRLAQNHPNLPIVIDHIGKPAIERGRSPDRDWVEGMTALAAQPNLWCKLSGMVTEAGPHWRQDDLAPFARIVVDAFGAGRTLWGSDWPVVDLVADYASWVESTRALAAHLDEDDRDRLFDRSARTFYGLDAPATRNDAC